jgi:hypothetical protein
MVHVSNATALHDIVIFIATTVRTSELYPFCILSPKTEMSDINSTVGNVKGVEIKTNYLSHILLKDCKSSDPDQRPAALVQTFLESVTQMPGWYLKFYHFHIL